LYTRVNHYTEYVENTESTVEQNDDYIDFRYMSDDSE
jgi:hypothetical protein